MERPYNIKETVPVNRGDGVYDFEMPTAIKNNTGIVSNITETKKLLLKRKYKKQYLFYFLFTILDFKKPLSKDAYINNKLLKYQQISEKKQIISKQKAQKKQAKSINKAEKKLLEMYRVRKSKAKNENAQRLIKYENVVNYIRSNKGLMSRKIKIKYKYIYHENKHIKVIAEGSEGFLSRTEVSHILKMACADKPTSQTGMTALVLLVQKTEKTRKIKEQLNKFWRYLWKW